MKNSLKVLGFAVAFLLGLVVGVGGLWLTMRSDGELRYCLLERSMSNQPQAQITAFAQAIARGDRAAALARWEIDNPSGQPTLARRRDEVIFDLIAAHVKPDYQVLGVEWWTTCCEPSVTCDSRNAGGARIQVQFLEPTGQPVLYTFDVFAREQPYWGSAAGYPARDWVVRDVYLHGHEPIFWAQVYESQIRYVQP